MFEELIEQIENDEINNDIINRITKIINEERSIPFEITNIINDIKYRLNDEVKKSPSLPYNKNYITFKKGQFDVRIFNETVKIIWEYYSFINEDLKNKVFINNKSGQLRKTIDGYEINITVRAVNGKIDFARTLEALQHEFEHFWERLHMGHPYKGMNLYKVADQLLCDTYNDYNQSIGRILYMSRKWEQRAYANGVYQYLMSHPVPNLTRENIKDTQLYRALIFLKKDVEKLKAVKEPSQHPFLRATLSKLRSDFGIQYEQIITIGEKAIDNIVRILGRTLLKAENDLSQKENGEILFPNHNYIIMNNS